MPIAQELIVPEDRAMAREMQARVLAGEQPLPWRLTLLSVGVLPIFAALDRMEGELLTSRARFTGGDWKLYRFFGVISQPGVGRAGLSERSTAFDRPVVEPFDRDEEPRHSLAAVYRRHEGPASR